MDVHNQETRSFNMSQIKGKDTKPEIVVRKYLHSNGFRYRLHSKELPGKPDIVLKKYKKVIQVQGCFWHKHEGCKYFVVPKTRTEWWLKKINRTAKGDLDNNERLTELGWEVITIWECELKPDKREETLSSLKKRVVGC